MTASAKTYTAQQTGINIMLAGLSCQAVSLFIFATMALEYSYRLYKNPLSWDTTHSALYESKLFKAFLCGLALATLTIFTRSIFRVAELSGSFHSSLANNQITFMVLEGAMITIACSCLSLLHPGISFRGSWSDVDFTFRTRKDGDIEKTIPATSDASGEAVEEENVPQT
jgi:hypothetical protein